MQLRFLRPLYQKLHVYALYNDNKMFDPGIDIIPYQKNTLPL